jgi:hypothetical protein
MVGCPDSKTEFPVIWSILTVGSPVVMIANIAIELGIANGTEVIINEVVPHPDDRKGWMNIPPVLYLEFL